MACPRSRGHVMIFSRKLLIDLTGWGKHASNGCVNKVHCRADVGRRKPIGRSERQICVRQSLLSLHFRKFHRCSSFVHRLPFLEVERTKAGKIKWHEHGTLRGTPAIGFFFLLTWRKTQKAAQIPAAGHPMKNKRANQRIAKMGLDAMVME